MSTYAQSRTRGTVEGKPASLHFDDDGLHWIKGQGNGTEWTIKKQNIISVTQADLLKDGHSVLYTKENSRGLDDDGTSPLRFESMRAPHLPPRLVEEFKPSEQCYWVGPGELASFVKGHVIISTGSGTGLASEIFSQLVEPLLHHLGLFAGEHFSTHTTDSDTSVAKYTKEVILPDANDGVQQSVLLLSGDGGIVDIVNTLLSEKRTKWYTKPKISLLPLGTGNALTNSSGITGDNTMGLRTMLQGTPKQLPLFRATFSPGARLLVNEGREERPLQGEIDGRTVAHGAVVCSWGHHATLVADSDTTEYRKFGAERFKTAAKEALFPSDGSPPHAYKGQVTVRRSGEDDWEVIGANEHGYVLATFVNQLEAGFTISPASKPLDGKLRLVHFGNLNGQEAMDVMSKAYQEGKHAEDERVNYEEIEALKIVFEEDEARWRRVCIDGKIVRVEKGGWVEVRPIGDGVVDLVAR
ncbi:hypothetical protein LTR37_014259 [Vermiconidia calcicola]|uniref:Uncharacterized protein n=1 Tax=Vermiconidia calcicola TaxID=1690605 RepID=A0ACC3MUD3_9PEZI|nr:hypothetical protein LTR37_014259 [Vermiconidia calcicola]